MAGVLAAEVRAATEKAGLAVASYYRAGHTDPAAFDDVLRSAVLLGAPSIRVWAGAAGPDETSPQAREAVIRDTRRAAALAAEAGADSRTNSTATPSPTAPYAPSGC